MASAEKPWILSVNYLPAGEEEAKCTDLFTPFGLKGVKVLKPTLALVTLDTRENCEKAIAAVAGTKFGERTLYVVFADSDENICTIILDGFTEAPTNDSVKAIVEKFGPSSYISIAEDAKSKKILVLVDLLGKYAKAMKAAAKKGELVTESGAKLSIKDSKKRAQPPQPKPAAAAPPKPAPAKSAEGAASAAPAEQFDPFAYVHPGILRDQTVLPTFPAPLVLPTRNEVSSPEVQAEHKQWLKDHHCSIVTRFPPEPNGYLHIGHVKAMFLDFGLANLETALGDKIRSEKKAKGEPLTEEDECKRGITYLRYDDTNPKGERQVFIDAIAETVKYLGHRPFKVTHTSDYFPQLYQYALDLIKRGLAYVDHQTKAQIKEGKDNKTNSPYRDRTVEENLRLFEAMRVGLCEEGECVLRLKIDMQNNNPNMRDPIIYRVMYLPHPMTGDEWCIYPTYDYSHCICDALEHVTHSLCTLEFEIRRDSYFWLLDVLNIHKPIVWEMSRLNMTHSVMSKRKVLELVRRGIVSGWDDPRLTSLAGLRRRGFSREILHSFVRKIGITRNDNTIQFFNLEHSARQYLNNTASRVMGVLDPLPIIIDNFSSSASSSSSAGEFAASVPSTTDSLGRPVEFLSVPNFPAFPERGSHLIPFSPIVLIDRSDFKEDPPKSFFGLAPGREVGLKYAGHLKCTSVEKDANGKIVCVHGEIDRERKNKVKGHLTWVAQTGNFTLPSSSSSSSSSSSEHPCVVSSPVCATVNCFDHLFLSEDLAASENWLAELNPDCLQTFPSAAVDIGVLQGNTYAHTHSSEDVLSGPDTATFDHSSEEVAALPPSPSSLPAEGIRHEDCFQFERLGFFCVDKTSILRTSSEANEPINKSIKLVLNRTVSLKDSDKKKE